MSGYDPNSIDSKFSVILTRLDALTGQVQQLIEEMHRSNQKMSNVEYDAITLKRRVDGAEKQIAILKEHKTAQEALAQKIIGGSLVATVVVNVISVAWQWLAGRN